MTDFHPGYILNAIIYSVLGIAIFLGAFVVVDRLTPYHLWKEIVEDKNIALAILVGAMSLGMFDYGRPWNSVVPRVHPLTACESRQAVILVFTSRSASARHWSALDVADCQASRLEANTDGFRAGSSCRRDGRAGRAFVAWLAQRNDDGHA